MPRVESKHGARVRPWLTTEETFLRKHKGVLSIEDMASQLDRTPAAVQMRCSQMGIADKIHRWTDAELELLASRLRVICSEVASAAGVSESAVLSQINNRGRQLIGLKGYRSR